MANATKLKDSKFSIVKPPADVVFAEPLRASVYVTKLREAIAAESVIQVLTDDSYMINQVKAAAKKIQVTLVFGAKDKFTYIKAIPITGELKKLIAWLREPRTVNDLKSKGLELDIESALASLAKDGNAHSVKDKWVLTDQGQKLVGN